ncbi:hypothetical protein ITP53_43810 [Nonomuraea sp. K274]|uniref:Uncharacterized protein n=1 Tax=Nonomuraea cypriaca TaxID=1187855 RepID=A0A931ALC6_9ACTN|nr:hypothetical protein [Nonomuraea cypriaca]MBF8192494.1 hypothetical protein [Nonomuraea cypriaca]
MRPEPPDLAVLVDRDCLVTFATLVLASDNAVQDHEMGYHQGGGTTYTTRKGIIRRTGLDPAAAERALHLLDNARLIAGSMANPTAWRTDTSVLALPADSQETPTS